MALTEGHPRTRPLDYLMDESSISSEFVSWGLLTFSLSYLFLVSWSLPLALKLCEHFMSTSMVTLKGACSITRPASRVDDAVESW